MTEFNNTVIDNVKGDKKMKLIICMFFTCFMLFIISVNESNISAESIDQKEIYNIDESVNLYVYEYNFENKHYIGYLDKYSGEFKNILNEKDEYINSDMFFPSISNDGKYISFTSSATNIVNNNNIECYDIYREQYDYCSNIYIYNVQTSEFFIIKSGKNYLNGNSYVSKISGDGKSVVFESLATNNLIPNNNICFEKGFNSCINIFKYTLITKSITLISTYSNNYGGDSNSINPSISYDGRYISFQSTSTNLGIKSYKYNSCVNVTETGEILCSHVYLVNTRTSSIDIITKNGDNLFNDNSGNPVISEDGQYVVYESYATNISDKFNYKSHVILFDVVKSENKIISCLGDKLNNRNNYLVSVSSDSKYIVYNTKSTNLNETGEVCLYVYNISNSKTSFISRINSNDIVSVVNDKCVQYYDNTLENLILDNTPPTIESDQEIYVVKDSMIKLEDKLKIDDNLSSKENIVINIDNNIILNAIGEYYIKIVALDEFDNQNSSFVKIIVIDEDTEAPVFNDINEIKILKGSSTLNLSNYIEAYDKVDGTTRIYIMDDGGLDLNSKGQYKVLLMSKDSSDNISYKEMKIVVYENFTFEYYYEIILILCLFGVIIFSIIRVK